MNNTAEIPTRDEMLDLATAVTVGSATPATFASAYGTWYPGRTDRMTEAELIDFAGATAARLGRNSKGR